MNAACSLHDFCLNHFKVLPALSEVEKVQKLPSIFLWFGCKKNILSIIVQKWYHYITVLRTGYTLGSRQAELTGMPYFMVDFKNKSYQLKFFKIVWMLYVLEYMERNDWLLFFYKGKVQEVKSCF